MSGSIHYFRVPEGLWADRLTKIRAAGFNAIQFVIPWNLHQRFPGNNADFSGNHEQYLIPHTIVIFVFYIESQIYNFLLSYRSILFR